MKKPSFRFCVLLSGAILLSGSGLCTSAFAAPPGNRPGHTAKGGPSTAKGPGSSRRSSAPKASAPKPSAPSRPQSSPKRAEAPRRPEVQKHSAPPSQGASRPQVQPRPQAQSRPQAQVQTPSRPLPRPAGKPAFVESDVKLRPSREIRQNRPESRPEARPNRPENRPEARPNRPESRPEVRPEARPEPARPNHPVKRPEARPNRPESRPEARPEPARPNHPVKRPEARPDRPESRPEARPDRPESRPEARPDVRPDVRPHHPGKRPDAKPDRPEKRPEPSRPNHPGGRPGDSHGGHDVHHRPHPNPPHIHHPHEALHHRHHPPRVAPYWPHFRRSALTGALFFLPPPPPAYYVSEQVVVYPPMIVDDGLEYAADPGTGASVSVEDLADPMNRFYTWDAFRYYGWLQQYEPFHPSWIESCDQGIGFAANYTSDLTRYFYYPVHCVRPGTEQIDAGLASPLIFVPEPEKQEILPVVEMTQPQSEVDDAWELIYAGDEYFRESRETLAEEKYARAMLAQTEMPDPYFRLAVIQMSRRQYVTAIQNAFRTLELSRVWPASPLALGQVYGTRTLKKQQDLDALWNAVSRDPNNAELRMLYGLMLYADAMGDMEMGKAAKEQFETAAAVNPALMPYLGSLISFLESEITRVEETK
ncbi:MAG: hypothetical protein J6J31_10265 [Thermoguttaceae bacterium]|nr:hypothetical protein [Thermoguttaceae bacterium]